MKKLTKENIYYIILIAILLVGIITRVIKFGEIPIGLNVDEAGIIYDAYCIEEYGTDRFNNSYPVYMINFVEAKVHYIHMLQQYYLKYLALALQ